MVDSVKEPDNTDEIETHPKNIEEDSSGTENGEEIVDKIEAGADNAVKFETEPVKAKEQEIGSENVDEVETGLENAEPTDNNDEMHRNHIDTADKNGKKQFYINIINEIASPYY